jgi:hypothetical protein
MLLIIKYQFYVLKWYNKLLKLNRNHFALYYKSWARIIWFEIDFKNKINIKFKVSILYYIYMIVK